MKLVIVLAFFVAAALAADDVEVILNDSDVKEDHFNYAYKLGNGIEADVGGALKDPETLETHGNYQFVAPDGETYKVAYIANENGYQPTGDHLPVAPEVPVLIQRALEYLATHAKPEGEKGVL